MKQCVFLFSLLFMVIGSVVAQEPVLDQLDRAIEQRDLFTNNRLLGIEKTKEILHSIDTDSEIRYEIGKKIAYQYLDFQIDSAIHYASLTQHFAQTSGKKQFVLDALLLKANVLIHAGLYSESIEVLRSVDSRELEIADKKYFYTMQASLYRFLTSYVGKGERAIHYDHLRIQYQDSTYALTKPSEGDFLFLKSEILENEKNLEGAGQTLLKDIAMYSESDRAYGPRAYRLANIYKKMGDEALQLEYLALSSISDLQNGVKEHASLRELALLLFERGEIKTAYRFINVAMEDALFADARVRSFEILKIFPLIDSAYAELKLKSQQRLWMFFFSIVLLSFILVYFLIQSRKKSRLLGKANEEIKSIFEQLLDANKQLKQYSSEKEKVNQQLESSVVIQEQYIAKYLRLCSGYIGKIDAYRKMLYKKKKSGASADEMIKILKSKEIIDEELKEFYRDFDDAFLTLHPDFVDQFNSLLKSGETIVLKKGERLNTELRIFALIRLGINESPQIAEFLRYSLTTIYNYRTRIRNRAEGERDDFENKVLKLR